MTLLDTLGLLALKSSLEETPFGDLLGIYFGSFAKLRTLWVF